MKFLFIQSSAPHGTINAQEGLDAVLMGSAFTECTVLFLREGVLQLLKDQDLDQLGTKNFAMTFAALADYGVTRIYADASSVAEYGLDQKDFVINVEVIEPAGIRALIGEHDRVLNF